MTDRPPRLIPYTRQSLGRVGETRETSLSLEAQRAVISDWAASNGFVMAEAIEDHDLKGDDPNRPGLLDLERAAVSGDTVAVYKFDRLARDIVLQESLVRRLQARNVQVLSVTEPSTRLTRVIYGAINEEFKDALSQRIKDTRKLQAQRGHYTGAGCPYGYQRSLVRAIPLPDGGEYLRPTGVLIPEPNEAAAVREAFERVAAGEPIFSIATDFNDRGIPTRRNSYWQATTLRRVIVNRFYYGVATYKGDEIAPGLHEPLVSRDLWEQANVLATRPKRRQKKHEDVSSWLEGYAYHACGCRMYLMSIQKHGDTMHYSQHFACQTAYQTAKCGYPRRHMAQHVMEQAARDCLEHDLSQVADVQEALASATIVVGGAETVARRAHLEERRARALGRYERVRDAWAAGMESLEWLAEEQAKRDTALTEIDAELAHLPAAPDVGRFETLGTWLRALPDLIGEADDSTLTALIAGLGHIESNEIGATMRYSGDLRYFIPTPLQVRLRRRG